MVIFLYGEDSFRRKKKYAEIVSGFIAKNGNMGFSEFSAEDLDKFLEAVKNRSMFSPRTLIGLKDVDIDDLPKDALSLFNETLSSVAESEEVNVIISSESPSLPKGSPFLVNPSTKTQEFVVLAKEKLTFFVTKEAMAKGIKISDTDANTLISSFLGDLWAIDSELDKLAVAQNRDLSGLASSGPSYFEALNAFKYAKTRDKKLIALETLLYKLKEDPARVFNGIAYFAPKGFSSEKWFEIMADYDIAVKSGRMGYEEALLDFAIR